MLKILTKYIHFLLNKLFLENLVSTLPWIAWVSVFHHGSNELFCNFLCQNYPWYTVSIICVQKREDCLRIRSDNYMSAIDAFLNYKTEQIDYWIPITCFQIIYMFEGIQLSRQWFLWISQTRQMKICICSCKKKIHETL